MYHYDGEVGIIFSELTISDSIIDINKDSDLVNNIGL